MQAPPAPQRQARGGDVSANQRARTSTGAAGLLFAGRCSNLLFVLLLLLLCGPSSGHAAEVIIQRRPCSERAGERPGQPFKLPKLRLQWDTWSTSQLVTSLAATILHEQLGFDVELVKKLSSSEVYGGLSTGDVHLAFEAWPASNPATYAEYAAPAAGGGPPRVHAFPYSALFGRVGLYETCKRGETCSSAAPQYLVADLLKSEAGKEHFQALDEFLKRFTPTHDDFRPKHCERPGANCTIPILHISPDYDKGIVEALVQKLELPAYVRYLGAEQHAQAIWTAFKNRTGALVYNYWPSTNALGISAQQLVRADIIPSEDFQPGKLTKLAWPGLRDVRGNDAYNFTAVFDLLDEDYAELGTLYDLYGNAQEAACVWYKAHEKVWRPWVKFPERKHTPLMCSPVPTGLCSWNYLGGWILCGAQLFVSIVLFWWAHYVKKPPAPPTEIRAKLEKAMHHARIEDTVATAPCVGLLECFGLHGNYKSRLQYLDSLTNVPTVMKHIRTYENFVKPNDDPSLRIPPTGPNDRWMADLNRASLFPYLFVSSGGDGMKPVLMICLALAFFSSAVGSFFVQYVTWETYRTDPVAYANGDPTSGYGTMLDTLNKTNQKFSALISAFIFFPAFLQIGYLGYAVNRWRSFQALGYNVSGCIKTNAMLIGASLTDPSDERCKELAYRIWRYQNVAHLLMYKSANIWFEHLEYQDLVTLGFLSQAELDLLQSSGIGDSEYIKLLWTWLVKDLYAGVAAGLLLTKQKYSGMASLRGHMQTWEGQFGISQPNLWAALMKFVCDLLILMFVLGSPFQHFAYFLGPFQYYVFIFTFLQAVPWLCASNLITCLNDPYKGHHDMFNVDALVAGVERDSFLYLRASFGYRVLLRALVHVFVGWFRGCDGTKPYFCTLQK